MPITKEDLTASLIRRFIGSNLNEPDIPWFDNPGLVLAELNAMQKRYTDHTFKVYRNLISNYCSQIGHDHIADEIRKLGAKKRGRKPGKVKEPAKAKPSPRNKAYRKVTLLSRDDYFAITQKLLSTYAKKPRYKWGEFTVRWLQCSISTGLRPSEWYGARLLKGGLKAKDGSIYMAVLECDTAKKGGWYNRTDQLTRRLILDDCSKKQIAMLERFLGEINAHYGNQEGFERLRANVRQTLIKACNQTFNTPGEYSLYTGRHTFIQEVRRANYEPLSIKTSRFELASLIGHSDTVNQKYYGDRKADMSSGRWFADLFDMPRPWPGVAEDIEALERERYKLVYQGAHKELSFTRE